MSGRIANILDETWNAALEAAAEACEIEERVFASTEYATGQPASSVGERFACRQCASAIRALKHPAPAEEMRDDG